MPNKQQEYYNECFEYFPETGEIRWKRRPREHFPYRAAWRRWNSRFAGTEAFKYFDNRHGWWIDWLDRKRVYAHHVAFTLSTGKQVKKIYHLDRDRTNNALSNITDVNPDNFKSDEYVVVYNKAFKNWNVQKNAYAKSNNNITTTLIAEFPTKQEAINYKNNREALSHDGSS